MFNKESGLLSTSLFGSYSKPNTASLLSIPSPIRWLPLPFTKRSCFRLGAAELRSNLTQLGVLALKLWVT
ncbi:MAG: hypothetical protein KFKLKKLM_02060 [Flavobacteriales bacterium]|nr:hypothetical protein [Flavobacteriales bacterium]